VADGGGSGGMGAGGMGGPPAGGMGGPPGGGPEQAPGRGHGPPNRPRVSDDQRARAERIRDEIAENDRVFLQRALELLTDAQRQQAEELLTDRPPPGRPPLGPRPPSGGPQP